MRHLHPRGKPRSGLNGWEWCPACVSQGITTFDEVTRPETPRRGKIKVGMTVEWLYELPNPTGAAYRQFDHRTGQVWSLADPDHLGVWSSGIEYWWVVDQDGRAYKVRQDFLRILSEGRADVCLV